MIEIEEALQIIMEQSLELKSYVADLASAHNHCLAEDIVAGFDIPSFDNSSVDGYALCGESKNYHVIAELAAGSNSSIELQPGHAARIFTGAPVPNGTTAVIMQEQVQREGQQIFIDKAPHAGSNIRKQGKEIRQGELVFPSGHFLTAASLGFISSLGISRLRLFKKPSIAILATGNELIEPGDPRATGQIYESSRISISAALISYGFDVTITKLVKDDPNKICETIAELLAHCDLLFVTGGISVGNYDFVRQALIDNEVQELFYKVKQKPGKPLYFGRKDEKFVFALPGNPASSLTCFYVYGLPLVQRLAGNTRPGLMRLRLPLDHDYELLTDRPSFLKSSVLNGKVCIRSGQESAMIKSFGDANALVFLPASSKLEAGQFVETLIL